MASTAIATRDEDGTPKLVKLHNQLQERAAEIGKALPAHISVEKFQRTIMTAVQNNPDLLLADRQSLIITVMKAAQDGLLLDGREAAPVIFNKKEKDGQGGWHTRKLVQYMPMVYGLRKKIVQSGEVVSLQTGVVYRAEMEANRFIYEIGLDPPIRHRPMLDLPAEEMTDDKIVAAYSIARMKDGSVSAEVLRRSEIDKVRECSQTGALRDRNGKPRQPFGPWVDWFSEQARKTAMRRHSKTLPMSGDLIIDVEGREQEAAESAARLLAVQPAEPMRLPSNEELDKLAEHEPQGLTETDEATARELDAQTLDESPIPSALQAAVDNLHDSIEAIASAEDYAAAKARFLELANDLPRAEADALEKALHAAKQRGEG